MLMILLASSVYLYLRDGPAWFQKEVGGGSKCSRAAAESNVGVVDVPFVVREARDML
jgi:hypothetical protein